MSKETFEKHNAVNDKGGKPHDDPKNQCQCADCAKHRAGASAPAAPPAPAA